MSIKLKSHQAAKVLSVVLAVLMDKTNSAPSVLQSSEKNVLVLWNFLFKNQVIAPADQLNSHQTEIKRWRWWVGGKEEMDKYGKGKKSERVWQRERERDEGLKVRRWKSGSCSSSRQIKVRSQNHLYYSCSYCGLWLPWRRADRGQLTSDEGDFPPTISQGEKCWRFRACEMKDWDFFSRTFIIVMSQNGRMGELCRTVW